MFKFSEYSVLASLSVFISFMFSLYCSSSSSASLGSKVMTNFTGFFHLTHNVMITLKTTFPSASTESTVWYAELLKQHGYQCLFLVSRVSYRFYKFLPRPFHSILLINWCCFLSVLLPLLFGPRGLLLFLVYNQYSLSFCHIIKKEFHVHYAIFLEVRLAWLLLMLKHHYIS